MTPTQKLAAIAKIFETKRVEKIQGHKVTTSTHAFFNMEGALIDIDSKDGYCDDISRKTLKRVSTQLAHIGRILEGRENDKTMRLAGRQRKQGRE